MFQITHFLQIKLNFAIYSLFQKYIYFFWGGGEGKLLSGNLDTFGTLRLQLNSNQEKSIAWGLSLSHFLWISGLFVNMRLSNKCAWLKQIMMRICSMTFHTFSSSVYLQIWKLDDMALLVALLDGSPPLGKIDLLAPLYFAGIFYCKQRRWEEVEQTNW